MAVTSPHIWYPDGATAYDLRKVVSWYEHDPLVDVRFESGHLSPVFFDYADFEAAKQWSLANEATDDLLAEATDLVGDGTSLTVTRTGAYVSPTSGEVLATTIMSSDLANVWTNSGVTVTGSPGDAYRVMLDTVGSSLSQESISYAAGTYTHTFYLQLNDQDETAEVRFRFNNVVRAIRFNKSTGALVSADSGFDAYDLEVTGGVLRITGTYTETIGTTNIAAVLPAMSGAGIAGTSYIDVLGVDTTETPVRTARSPLGSAAGYVMPDVVTNSSVSWIGVYGGATNIVECGNVSAAYWTKGNATITSDTERAPDGSATASRIIDTSSTSTHEFFRASVGSAGAHTWSVYAKADSLSWISIRIDGASSYFDLASGVTGTSDAGNTSEIYDCGNGWYRCAVTRNLSGSTFCVARLSPGDGVDSYEGDGSGMLLWCPNLTATTSLMPSTPHGSAAGASYSDTRPVTDSVTHGAQTTMVLGMRLHQWQANNPTTDFPRILAKDGVDGVRLQYADSDTAAAEDQFAIVDPTTLTAVNKLIDPIQAVAARWDATAAEMLVPGEATASITPTEWPVSASVAWVIGARGDTGSISPINAAISCLKFDGLKTDAETSTLSTFLTNVAPEFEA